MALDPYFLTPHTESACVPCAPLTMLPRAGAELDPWVHTVVLGTGNCFWENRRATQFPKRSPQKSNESSISSFIPAQPE